MAKRKLYPIKNVDVEFKGTRFYYSLNKAVQ